MKLKLICASLLVALMSACAVQTASINPNAGDLAKSDAGQVFWVSGIGQTDTVDAAAVCGGASKVAKVEREYTPLNWLLGAVTLGIYTPKQARVYCVK